jgi:hypothetical protein
MTSQKKAKTEKGTDGPAVLKDVLSKAEPRPQITDKQSEKTKYAIRFAEAMAAHIASDLRDRFVGITASTKRDATSSSGRKQLDVNFSTPRLGLALGISLKSVHVRDVGSGHKYGHNKKRNTEELLVEVTGYHRRQPYAVMIGVLFLPFDSCSDGKRANPSSFGSWVRHLRPYVGRLEPEDDTGLFETMYIALYEPDGTDLGFFDVESDPPKNTRPRSNGPLYHEDPDERRPIRLLTYSEFLGAVHHAYLERNPVTFKWDDGEEEILDLEGAEEEEEDEDS